jgi:hypothetical protein
MSMMTSTAFQLARYLLVVLSGQTAVESDTYVTIAKDDPDLLQRFAFGFRADQPDERDENKEKA